MSRSLRAHQVTAIEGVRSSLMAGKRRPMLALPTGAGKTIIAAKIVESALAKGRRPLFVVPALSLVDQTVQAFWSEGIRDVGVIQADHPMTDYGKPVQVASIQTLSRRGLPKCDFAIIDEAHKVFEFQKRWFAMEEWSGRPIIGLSATPWTRGLGKLYDDLIIPTTTAEMIRDGWLSPFRVFAPSHPDLTGVRTVAGDYHEGDLSEAMDRPPLVADVVETWARLGEGRPTLCFGVDRAHAKHLQSRFTEAGIPAGYIDAYTEAAERQAVRGQLDRGEIRVVCNVGCLTTGVDWDVRCIILARPTKSISLFVQIIGRGLRTAPGKDDLLILDHSDTHLRLGFVTDIHRDRLDGGAAAKAVPRERKAPLPKDCSECGYVKPAKVHVCPACGHKPEKQPTIETEDGDLVEMGVGKKANREMSGEAKARFFGQLKALGRDRGYKPGWAANQYRQKFGVWPNAHADAPEIDPSPEVLSWVRSRQIAFAKARAKHGGGDARAA